MWADPEQLEARTWLAKLYRLSSADSEEDKVDRKWEEAGWGVGSAGHISDNSGQENK